MENKKKIRKQLTMTREFGVRFAAIVVAAHGIFILASSLLVQIAARREARVSAITIDLPLLVGMSLIYLSVLLNRKKRTAWVVTVLAYTFYLGVGIENFFDFSMHARPLLLLSRTIILPVLIVALLISLRKHYTVRSDTQGFRVAARTSLLILMVAFIYGVAGFQLFDKSDFHQEISLGSAIHHTLDQFDLTTNSPLHPYTKRAHLFIDSLSFVSVGAIGYALISLFQPLRARFSDQTQNRQQLSGLLSKYGGLSEDFFKLWPHDKQYYFDDSGQAGLAVHVFRGVALCLGDPVGSSSHFKALMATFLERCQSNDWLPAFIHVQDKQRKLYEKNGFSLQKIGQEAVLDIDQFLSQTATAKYFRQINNKFTKQGYTYELLSPPHHGAITSRLKQISDEWLTQPGRVERGFAMGYFTNEYLEQCQLAVIRDAAGTIQAFMNFVPAEFDHEEATYDLLRHTATSLGNSNDFLLLNAIGSFKELGYRKLNLGLCPLVGLDEATEERKTLIDGVLRFAYANGDRFYSFSGLYRFKSKYAPEWRDRYIAYQSGIRGFTRTTNALNRAMRVRKHLLPVKRVG